MVDAVDLPADEDADPAVAPLAPVGQQEGNQQSQTCKHNVTAGEPAVWSHCRKVISSRVRFVKKTRVVGGGDFFFF